MGIPGKQLPILLTVLSAFLSPSLPAAEKTGPLEESLRPLMDQAGQVQVRLPAESPEARDAAEDLLRIYQSDAFQERIRMERQRLSGEFFGGAGEEVPDTKATEEGSLDSGGRFYLFVSSSVPQTTLRNYAADLARMNDPRFVMVLRGFVGGAKRIGPTASFIADVLKVDADCDPGRGKCVMLDVPFIVDPLLFRTAGIEQVPALAWLRGEENDPQVVCGDASIGYLMEFLAREGAK